MMSGMFTYSSSWWVSPDTPGPTASICARTTQNKCLVLGQSDGVKWVIRLRRMPMLF